MKFPLALDTTALLRQSRFALGPLRARGIPAVLLGVGALVAARGAVRALSVNAALLPEIVREMRGLLETQRRSKPLNP